MTNTAETEYAELIEGLNFQADMASDFADDEPDPEDLAFAQLLRRSATALRSILAENARLKEALERIAAWKMPETGEFWPGGDPISYAAQFGANGERDLVRQWARAALNGGSA